jgi:hypothetical protein
MFLFLYLKINSDMIRRLQDILDQQVLSDVVDVEVVEEVASDEEDVPVRETKNFSIAKVKFKLFEELKGKRFCSTFDISKASVLCDEDVNGKTWEIVVGPIEEGGANLALAKTGRVHRAQEW